jgi:hypothetical protein
MFCFADCTLNFHSTGTSIKNVSDIVIVSLFFLKTGTQLTFPRVVLLGNERLFREMYAAYRAGRADKNPSESWYGGELWFFENYVIPLAKKLKDCGVFGVSGDEYLTYALQNRREWEIKGQDVVKAMEERAIAEEEKDNRSRAQTMESVEEEASTGSGETSSVSVATGASRRSKSKPT